jgi:hypothetical protein
MIGQCSDGRHKMELSALMFQDTLMREEGEMGKIRIAIVVALVFNFVAGGEASQKGINVREAIGKIHSALAGKNYGQALDLAQTTVKAEPNNAIILFVTAEAQGANGDVFGSLKSLDDALKNGYDNKNAIYSSKYLSKTRASAGFNELMVKYGMGQAKSKKKAVKYRNEDSISAGDVRINMKEVFKDE